MALRLVDDDNGEVEQLDDGRITCRLCGRLTVRADRTGLAAMAEHLAWHANQESRRPRLHL